MSKKQRRIAFNHKPLQINYSMEVVGNVPDTQNKREGSTGYSPDYTITPLILMPHVSVVDPDGEASQEVNASLGNITWTEVLSDGTSTVIGSSNAGYEITTSGASAGQIKVKRNVTVRDTLTLRFSASYVDPRTNAVHQIRMSHSVTCDSEAAVFPTLVIDYLEASTYDPLHDSETIPVKVRVIQEGAEVPAAQTRIKWLKLREDGTFSEYGTDVLDYETVISADSKTATVNRQKMGDRLDYIVRASYCPDAAPTSASVWTDLPDRRISMVRQLCDYDWENMSPLSVAPNSTQVQLRAGCSSAKSEITDPEREILFEWVMATAKADGTLGPWTTVGYGKTCSVSTAMIDKVYGAAHDVIPHDRGAWKAWADTDGSVVTDTDGAIILIR